MSKKASNKKPIICTANGYINNGVCGFVIDDGKYCGLPAGRTCLYQKQITKPDPPPAPTAGYQNQRR